MTTYTHPDKAPEGHKWQTKFGDCAHWTGGYSSTGMPVFEIHGYFIEVFPDGSNNQARIIDAPKRPMEIPWDVIKDEWICAAVDRSGMVCLYTSRPTKDAYDWHSRGFIEFSETVKYERGDMPWDQSLVWRPGHEPEDRKHD